MARPYDPAPPLRSRVPGLKTRLSVWPRSKRPQYRTFCHQYRAVHRPSTGLSATTASHGRAVLRTRAGRAICGADRHHTGSGEHVSDIPKVADRGFPNIRPCPFPRERPLTDMDRPNAIIAKVGSTRTAEKVDRMTDLGCLPSCPEMRRAAPRACRSGRSGLSEDRPLPSSHGGNPSATPGATPALANRLEAGNP